MTKLLLARASQDFILPKLDTRLRDYQVKLMRARSIFLRVDEMTPPLPTSPPWFFLGHFPLTEPNKG